MRIAQWNAGLISTLAAAVTLCIGFAVPAAAQGQGNPPVVRGAEVVETVVPFRVDVDLRDLPRVPAWRPGDPIKEIPRRFYPRGDEGGPREPVNPTGTTRDPLLDRQASAPQGVDRVITTPDLNMDGQGFSGVNPPDTVGDVGTSYYIQMINDSGGAKFTVYDKNTGAVVAGPTSLDSLGSGFCGNGLGDPIVLYDQLAGRWLLSEFSRSGNRLCVYVSQTGDPLSGGWYAYDFQAPSFPDYPKYAVWPDAYYVGTNESGGSPAYALERSQMLIGGAASSQRFTAPDLAGFGFQMLTPSDVDGPAPPAGSPAYFVRHNDDERHNAGGNDPTADFLEIFEFDVDFSNPANSSFTGPIQVPISEIDSGLCGFTSFSCVDQPGTSVALDPLREVVMWRSQYRNFGSHEVLVGSLATDASGADQAGVRWYELRKSGGGGWALHQEGTYAIDGDSRWMSSAAMDGDGNIVVGYNVSSTSTFPGLRYAGRLAGDPLGTLPQGEATLVNGTASNSSNRYGDYSSLNVDPVDQCTMWFTGEYNAASAWSTRIGRFVFGGCGSTCGDGIIEGSEVCDGSNLGGETCGGQGCTGGGALACLPDCSGFDTSGCIDCPICDDDGICEAGEDCNTCPNDCVSGLSGGAVCGNGICEAGDGEDCLSCAADCAGTQNGKPGNRYCCGDGDGQNPVDCSDSRCTTGGVQCTDVPALPTTFCCGDLTCDSGENCANCALDCTIGVELCTGGLDDDCDGAIDCDDSDCAGDPACVLSCIDVGFSCQKDSDCCTGNCSNGPPSSRVCQ